MWDTDHTLDYYHQTPVMILKYLYIEFILQFILLIASTDSYQFICNQSFLIGS
jgi:hypothetical protein